MNSKKHLSLILVLMFAHHLDAMQWLKRMGYSMLFNQHIDAISESERYTPLMFAIKGRQVSMVKSLLEMGADINKASNPSYKPEKVIKYDVWNGIYYEKYETWRKVLDAQAQTPLYIAAEEGFDDLVKLLIAADAALNIGSYGHDESFDKSPLHIASEKNHIEIVKLLIAAGADVDAKDEKGRSPLHIATEKGHIEIVELLVAARADVNARDENKKTSLRYALINSNYKITKTLIEAGTLIDNKDLTIAIKNRDIDSIKYLIEKGANVDDYFGPLNEASRHGFADVVRILIKAGANIERRVDGETSLHIAAKYGHTDVAYLLIKAGSRINSSSSSMIVIPVFSKKTDETALHLAIKNGHIDMVKMLIEAGACISLTNYENETPLQIAQRSKNTALLEYMLEHELSDFHQNTCKFNKCHYNNE